MKGFDTHLHLDDPFFDDVRAPLWQQALDSDICGAITIGIEPKTWARSLQIGRELKNAHVALAIHPMWIGELLAGDIDRGLELLDDHARSSSIIAIGECGLHAPAGNLELQIKVLERHIELAKKHHLPLLLHVVRAHDSLLSVLHKNAPIDVPIVMHSYSGSAESLSSFRNLDCYFSFASPIRNPLAKKPRNAAKAVALDRLVVETDAPFQPAQGAIHSSPLDLHAILHELAALRSTPPLELADSILRNTARCFPSLHDCCSSNRDGVA